MLAMRKRRRGGGVSRRRHNATFTFSSKRRPGCCTTVENDLGETNTGPPPVTGVDRPTPAFYRGTPAISYATLRFVTDAEEPRDFTRLVDRHPARFCFCHLFHGGVYQYRATRAMHLGTQGRISKPFTFSFVTSRFVFTYRAFLKSISTTTYLRRTSFQYSSIGQNFFFPRIRVTYITILSDWNVKIETFVIDFCRSVLCKRKNNAIVYGAHVMACRSFKSPVTSVSARRI